MDDTTRLDPATLRALAAELDDEEEAARRECRCTIHILLADLLRDRAALYRTRAIRAEHDRDDS